MTKNRLTTGQTACNPQLQLPMKGSVFTLVASISTQCPVRASQGPPAGIQRRPDHRSCGNQEPMDMPEGPAGRGHIALSLWGQHTRGGLPGRSLPSPGHPHIPVGTASPHGATLGEPALNSKQRQGPCSGQPTGSAGTGKVGRAGKRRGGREGRRNPPTPTQESGISGKSHREQEHCTTEGSPVQGTAPATQTATQTASPAAKHQHLPRVTCKEHPVFHKTQQVVFPWNSAVAQFKPNRIEGATP